MGIKLGIRLVLYFVIITIVRIVIGKTKEVPNTEFQTKTEVYCIDKKGLAKIYLFVAIGFTILFIFVGSFPSNVEGATKLVIASIAVICNIVLYVCAWKLFRWSIKISDEKVVYCNGKTTEEYYFKEISYAVVDTFGNLMFHHKGKEIFTISTLEGRALILDRLKENNIQVRNKNEIHEFVVEVGGFYKGLSIVVALCAIGLFILCSAFSNFLGIVLFFLVTILALYNCMSQLIEKYYITEDGICAVRFLKKRKKVLFSEIEYIKEKHSGSTDFIVIFSEKGKEFSINKAYKNAYELEKIVHKKKWKSKQR